MMTSNVSILDEEGDNIWLKKLEKAYPLPPAPPSQCRDAYIEELLEPYDKIFMQKSEDETEDSDMPHVKFNKVYKMEENFDNTQLLLDQFFDMNKKKRSTISSGTQISRFEYGRHIPDINRLLKDRYDNIAAAIGFLSVLFQFQELKHRLSAIRDGWKMNSSVDKTLRIFSWSITDYLARFNLPNVIYLDAVEYELKNRMECFKFRTDLREIMRLVEAVEDDVRNKRDICESSMLVIKDAEIDIMELLTTSQKEAEEQNLQITLTKNRTPRSADPDRSRAKALNAKIFHNDFYVPIESRYRLKWSQTTMEQTIMYDDFNLKRLTDELAMLQSRIIETKFLWELSGCAYEMEINKHKHRIFEVEQMYEQSIELVDNEHQLTMSKVNKVRDDLKYCQDQIPIFHMKIAEVLEIYAAKEAALNPPIESIVPERKSKLKKKAAGKKNK